MMEYTWLVEKYLEGELSGEELHRFELEILRKPEVAEEVERIRSLNRFIAEQHQKMNNSIGLIEDFDDFENIVSEEEIGRDLEELKIKKISSSGKDILRFKTRIMESRAQESLIRFTSDKVLVRKALIWFAAASMALLIAASYLVLGRGNQTDYEALYNQYYVPRPADVGRAAAEIPGDPYQEALRAYGLEDYGKAFQLFNSIREEGAGNMFFLYKGITAMELGKYPVAVEAFKKLDQDVNLKHEGLWYKSLCYLMMGDPKAARSVLNDIIRTDGYYKDMAISLRRKI